MTLVKRALPKDIPIQVTEILPRLKDGGAFVRFTHPKSTTADEIEDMIVESLKQGRLRPWFNPFRPVKANLVRGAPWLEDLYRFFPSSRLKVEFTPAVPGGQAAELSQEQLYSLFRRYGKLGEIYPQAADSKILPRFAYLDFLRVRNAVTAKNCMHNFKLSEELGGKTGTLLRLSYEQKIKRHVFRDWIMNHPRIVLPVVAGLIATLSLIIFNPVRTFFIKTHITHTFDIQDSRIYRWFATHAKDIFTFHKKSRDEDDGLAPIWDDRKPIVDQIKAWMMETADTFIVVQGPRGSGKKELVMSQALKARKHTLVIDCKPIQEARGDSPTISALAKQVGYRPVFSWMNSFSSLIDIAAQGTIGVKSGLSETLDTQMEKILGNTAAALKQLGVEGRDKKDKDAHLSDDDYLEAHPEKRPTIIIDNFLHKSDERAMVYDKLSQWAASLTTANIAHVIFLTTDVSYSKALSKALPDRVFRQIDLGDITPEVAKRFVINQLNSEEDPSGQNSEVVKAEKRTNIDELDECIRILGGRLTDLEFLARRLKTGQEPKQAVQEIVDQSASEILKLFLLSAGKEDRKFSSEQAWYIVKSLATKEQLRYSEVLLSNTFAKSLNSKASNGESALDALAQAELINIQNVHGRPESIKCGRPVFQAAFKMLTEDKVLKARMDFALLMELTKIETKNIDKYESELEKLATLQRQPNQIYGRVQFLLNKLDASQRKIEGWEKEMVGLKKVLSETF